MRLLPTETNDPNLLVGTQQPDDAGVYKLTDELALIQTVDFFTPIVDDPYMFGQIAAANSLSDVYAMGGSPKTVLNIVAFPINKLGPDVLAEIFKGANDKIKESGAHVVGGHSIEDEEPKYGLSVTGIVHPDKFYRNIGAQPGDVLVLTKPIGVGILTTAIKQDLVPKEQIDQATDVMRTLNKYATESLAHFNPNAVTDVTGFGLLGHAFEMVNGSDVSFSINYKDVPLLPGTKEFAKQNIIPGGSRDNHKWLEKSVEYKEDIQEFEQIILCDSMTSGGLLISLPEREAEAYIKHFQDNFSMKATVIGKVIEQKEKPIYIK